MKVVEMVVKMVGVKVAQSVVLKGLKRAEWWADDWVVM